MNFTPTSKGGDSQSSVLKLHQYRVNKVRYFLTYVHLCKSGYSGEHRYCFLPWVDDTKMLNKWFFSRNDKAGSIYFCLWISYTASDINLISRTCAFVKIVIRMLSYFCWLKWSVRKYLQYFQHSVLHISSLYITWENWLLAVITIITTNSRRQIKRKSFIRIYRCDNKPIKIS